jgi:outer membrane protein assembly factor BamB
MIASAERRGTLEHFHAETSMPATTRTRTICASILILFSIEDASYADNWPGWRGPRGDGTSAEVHVPTQWSATDNVAWKVAIPGEGHACPVVWGERVFIATAMAEQHLRLLMCLDRKTGATLWQRTVVTSSPETKHQLNTYASSTPATDGDLVYATFFQSSDRTIVATNVSAPREVSVGKMVVAAFDFEGNQKWIAEPGEFISVHGYCSCPVLFENLLIVNGDHDGDSFLVALNKLTGKIEWKVPRVNKTRSYCTPIIRELAGRTQMIMSGNKSVTSYNPRTGELLWNMDGPTEQFVASMVDNGRYVFLTAGYPDKHILAIDPTGLGRIDESKIAWRSKRNCAYVPSPIVVGNESGSYDSVRTTAVRRFRRAAWSTLRQTMARRRLFGLVPSMSWYPSVSSGKNAILRQPLQMGNFSFEPRTTYSALAE